MESNRNFTISKINLILIAVGFVIIILGFILMSGVATQTDFNPDVFSTRRITIGPMISFFGFIFVIFAILFESKNK